MTKQQLKGLAHLSMLQFTDEQYKVLEGEFESIIAFLSELKNTKPSTEDLDTTVTSVTLNDLREDIVRPSLPIELSLLNAPQKKGRYFVVPQVVE